MLRVLLTNDDGIEAEGLQALRRALLRVPGVELAVIAPDDNRSAIGRGITTRRPPATSSIVPTSTRFMWRMNVSASMRNSRMSPSRRSHAAASTSRRKRVWEVSLGVKAVKS